MNPDSSAITIRQSNGMSIHFLRPEPVKRDTIRNSGITTKKHAGIGRLGVSRVPAKENQHTHPSHTPGTRPVRLRRPLTLATAQTAKKMKHQNIREAYHEKKKSRRKNLIVAYTRTRLSRQFPVADDLQLSRQIPWMHPFCQNLKIVLPWKAATKSCSPPPTAPLPPPQPFTGT